MRIISILFMTFALLGTMKAQIAITGTVVDETREPLPGVNIIVKGTTNGTVTDFNGHYTIQVPDENAVLQVTFVGYTVKEIVVGSRRTIDVEMQEDMQLIEEVVVVGYGTMKKRDVLGSISTLKADDILKTRPTSMDAALQGMSSGVTVTSSGVPGAPVQVKVRGINSISSGTDPMWVIDGIPVASGTMGASINGAVDQNILSMINPADIESIEVLKDAAATSIYGSRGSNGVILVTTKSGKAGKATFDVDIRTGVSNWTKSDVGIASGKEYVEILDLARKNYGYGLYDPSHSLGQLDRYSLSMTREQAMATNTRWADEISRLGSYLDARVSASSGTEKTSSYLSLNYRKDNSNLRFNDLQTFSANVNLKYNALKALTLGYRMLVSYTDNNRVLSGDGKQGGGGWGQVNSMALPWYKVHDPAGINGYWNPESMINPLAGADPVHCENNLQTLNLITGLTADLKLPVEGLTLRGEMGINYVNSKAESWRSEVVRINGAQAVEQKAYVANLNFNTYLNYNTSLNDIHNFNLTAGVEGTRSISHTSRITGTNLVGIFHEVGTPGSLSGSSSLGGESYLIGFFGRANYNLLNKYYVGFSMRRDGISKFINENRWATFMAGSLGWVISEESFFNVDAINLLKLRGSYGQTGNTNIPTGITEDIWSNLSGDNTLQFTNSKRLTNFGNPYVKWETTSTMDVGFDFGLFKNRINGSIAYYNQRVVDMLLRAAIPISAGLQDGNTIWQNIGDMENHGLEVNLDAAIISKKDFKLNIGGNFSTNKNKVLALTPELDAEGNGIFQDGDVREIIKKGLPLGNWYMAEYAGVDPQKGIPMIYEVEVMKDGSTRHTGNTIPATTTNLEKHRMILDGKTSIPKITGGFNMNMVYKNFDFNMLWNFAAGHYIYNRLRQSLMTPDVAQLMTLSKDMLTDTWRQPGDNAKYPMATLANGYFYNDKGEPSATAVQYGSENKSPSTLYLEKGDYLRLKNLQIGYTIPMKSANFKNSVRVYVSASNLFTVTKFTGYDPEVNISGNISSVVFVNQLPQTRVFSLGLSTKF